MSGTLALPTTGTFSGLQEQTYINTALAALTTLNQGSSAPTTASTGLSSTAGLWWHDTANNLLKLRDQADSTWIAVASFDETNKQFLPLIGGGVAIIASAATVDLGSVPQTGITISGTTAVTSFGTSMLPGQVKLVTFSGALTLAYNATSMILPGGASITTAAGDMALVECLASGNFRVLYQKASGQAVTAAGTGPVAASTRNLKANLASAGTSVTFTADEIITETALGGTTTKLASYSQTLNIGGTGAGGMDTGTAPASGYVSVYAISGPSGTSILAWAVATSSGTLYTGANLPSGYTASALIGIWPTNGTPQLVAGYVLDRKFWYRSGGVVISSSLSCPQTSLTSLSIAGGVPAVAKTVDGIYGKNTNTGAALLIASYSDGTGSQQLNSPVTGGVTWNGIDASVTFLAIPLLTAQTIYWGDQDTGTGLLAITAYTW